MNIQMKIDMKIRKYILRSQAKVYLRIMNGYWNNMKV